MAQGLIVQPLRQRIEDTILNRVQTPFPNGSEWPLVVAAIDHIVDSLNLAEGWNHKSRTPTARNAIIQAARQIACVELQKRLVDGVIRACDDSHLEIEKEFWRYICPSPDGGATDPRRSVLPWFTVSARDILAVWPATTTVDALEIESSAKIRLADEYDAAHARGEVRSQSDNQAFSKAEKAGTAEVGLTSRQVHEARQIRDAERANPGIVHETLSRAIEAGEVPIATAVNSELPPAQNSRSTQVVDVILALRELYPNGPPAPNRPVMRAAVEQKLGRQISLKSLDRARTKLWGLVKCRQISSDMD